MKKILIALITFALLILITFPVLAGGDKVRGENGAGSVVQHQESGNPYAPMPGPQP